jgi:AbiU2
MTVPKATDPDPVFDGWKQYVESLDWHVAELVQKRADWWALQQVFQKNRNLPPSGFFDFIVSNYVDSASIAVRRLVDQDKRTLSLLVLLDSMRDSCQHLSRERYTVTCGWTRNEYNDSMVSDQFDEFVGCESHDFVPEERINTDRNRLLNASNLVKQYVDKQVAHNDKKTPKDYPTYGDLHLAIGEIEAIFSCWYKFLTGVEREVMPRPLGDWFAPLRVAWISGENVELVYGEAPALPNDSVG